MNGRLLLQLAVALGLTLASILAIAAAVRADAEGIEVQEPFARASIGQATSGVVYLRLVNHAATPDRLTGATTAAAARADLHVTEEDGGVVKMRRLDSLEIAAGGEYAFEPGGAHIMLTGLTAPLPEGEHFLLTLQFDTAGEVTIKVPVRSIAAGADGGGHDTH